MYCLEFDNSNKNPNGCHDYLIKNNIFPISFQHDREYNNNGILIKEAEKFYITVNDEEKEIAQNLINDYLNL